MSITMRLAALFLLVVVFTSCVDRTTSPELESKRNELMAVVGILYGQVSMEATLAKFLPEQVGPLCKSLEKADRVRDKARQYGFEDAFVESNEGVIMARELCKEGR